MSTRTSRKPFPRRGHQVAEDFYILCLDVIHGVIILDDVVNQRSLQLAPEHAGRESDEFPEAEWDMNAASRERKNTALAGILRIVPAAGQCRHRTHAGASECDRGEITGGPSRDGGLARRRGESASHPRSVKVGA